MALSMGVTVVHVSPSWKKIMCIKPEQFECDNEELMSYLKERLNK